VRRGFIIGAAVAAALGIVAAVWLWKHTQMATLTPAELKPKLRIPLTADELAKRIRFSQLEQQPARCPEVAQVLALSRPPSGSVHEKPVKSTTSLGPDEIMIYRAVLEQWRSRGWTSLNVSVRTYPLDATDNRSGLSNCECLHGIYVEGTSTAFRSFHELTPDILPGKKMRLVDPKKQAAIVRANDPDEAISRGEDVEDAGRDAEASALFSMSEIAFDRDHRYAIVSYSYWCGGLCGQGATLVFEKIRNEWKSTKRFCGGWIS
jgi:predicted outer membrane lipoprotein